MQNEINEINTGNKLAKLFINVKSLNNEWAYKRTEVQYFEKSFGEQRGHPFNCVLAKTNELVELEIETV